MVLNVDINTPGPILGISTPVITTPFGSPDLWPVDMFEDMDVDVSPYGDAPLTGTRYNTPITGTEDAPATDTEDSAVAVPTVTRPVGILSTTDPTFRSPSPVSLDTIDEVSVPAFLIHHGKGKREVNIFNYLKNVDDPHFQQVLFHYLHFKINDKSGKSRSLPTTKRPAKISQWTSRARPANLPNYEKGKQTFVDFVDSVRADLS